MPPLAAGACWVCALLPLVAKQNPSGGSLLFGLLLGCFGPEALRQSGAAHGVGLSIHKISLLQFNE